MSERVEIIKLAKETVEEYVLQGKLKEVPENLTPEMKKKAGVFVTIKKEGKLRGCIGTIRPTQENVAREIISNAISSADHDPRFKPVSPDELDQLDFSVDILGKEELVGSLEELDPARYGIIIKGGHQTGLLLPDLEGINTPEEQVAIAKRKAGLREDAKITIYKFEVKRFE